MKKQMEASKPPLMSVDEIRAFISKQAAVLEADDIAHYRAQAAQYAERLSWAPAIGNGTAIVALAGIVGNVPSPDAALSGLTWPLAVFSVGLALGLVSIVLTGRILDLVSTTQSTVDQINSDLLELVDSGTALVEGATPENAAERLEKAELLLPEAEKVSARHRKLMRQLKWAQVSQVLASIANATAVLTVALGLAVLLIGHSTGKLRLEPSQRSVTTST